MILSRKLKEILVYGNSMVPALALLLDALIAVLIGLSAFWIEEVMPAFWIYR